MPEPRNEQGVVWRFASIAEDAGWTLVDIGAAFPDAVLMKDGEEWRIEFEYCASSFIDHRHDPRQVDAIICWINDLPDSVLPIIALSDPEWQAQTLFRVSAQEKETEYWKRRAIRAESHVRKLTAQMGCNEDGEPQRITPAQRRAEIAAQNISDPIEIVAQYKVSLRTAQEDLRLVRDGMMQTNGAA